MPIIFDPDQLSQSIQGSSGTPDGSVYIDTANKTIELISGQGAFSDDGVTLLALYSFLKEEWRTDASLIQYSFPMEPITPEQFELKDGWEFANDTTRKLIRTGGWREVEPDLSVKREYLSVITLGDIDIADTAYYAFENDTAKTDFTFSGPVNEAIQVFGDASNGNFDKRSEILTLFVREQGKLYGQVTTTTIGVSVITPKVERFPLSEAADLKISTSDVNIGSQTPFTGMSITYFDAPQQRSIGGSNYDFGIIIDGNGGTAEQIYEFVQFQLRQATDIDGGAGNQVGQLADSMLQFVGDNLETLSANNPAGGGSGIYIDNFQAADTNRIEFTDNIGVGRTFPFVAAGAISFNANLVNDADAVYRMFFSSGFGTAGALLVNDNSGSPISGDVSGRSSVAFDFDYDGNTQGGRTPGTDAPVTIVAMGLGGAQHVVATGTITRSNQNSFSVVASLERSYSNPA